MLAYGDGWLPAHEWNEDCEKCQRKAQLDASMAAVAK